MEERNDSYFNREFVKIVMDSGYRVDDHPDFVAELLQTLYEYMSEKVGVERQELSAYIVAVTRLLGPSHVQTLSVDDMCDWIVWYKTQDLPNPEPENR